MRENPSGKASTKRLSDRFFPFTFFGALAVAGIAAWYQAQPVEGQLILSNEACRLIEYHRGKVSRTSDNNLCVIRATFRAPERRMMTWVRINTHDSAFEVRLVDKEVVSVARR